MARIKIPIEERRVRNFFLKVEKIPNGCWIWKATTEKRGYGKFRFGKQHLLAHRFSYELVKGKIPEGLQLDHLCKVTGCVNPDHLEPVTPKENIMRGDSFSAINAKKKYCPKGHPYNDENTLLCKRPNGDIKRRCKACQAEYMRTWKANKQAA